MFPGSWPNSALRCAVVTRDSRLQNPAPGSHWVTTANIWSSTAFLSWMSICLRDAFPRTNFLSAKHLAGLRLEIPQLNYVLRNLRMQDPSGIVGWQLRHVDILH